MNKFYVGQKVVIVLPGADVHGEVCTIVSGPFRSGNLWRGDSIIASNVTAYETDLTPHRPCAPDGSPWWHKGRCFPPEYLKPYYDGNEPCAWTDELFNPIRDSRKSKVHS